MKTITGESPQMWGGSIVGFGEYTYTYASGKTGDWPLIGFSPRAAKMSIYLMSGAENHTDLLKKLGKHKIGKSCLYVNNLSDIHIGVLEELISISVKTMIDKWKT